MPFVVSTITTLLVSLLFVMAFYTNLHAETSQYPDPLLTTPVTTDVFSKGLEADGYALGVMVYTWGYPLVRMERVMQEYIDVPTPNPATSYRALLNKIGSNNIAVKPAAQD